MFYIPEHTIIKISLFEFQLDYLTNDDQGSKHVQNTSNSLPFDTKSYHRRLASLDGSYSAGTSDAKLLVTVE